jgi:sn-1 stearoyl-lipid 9-desaturase
MNTVEFRRNHENKIQWFTIGSVIVYHALAVWALFTFSWQNLAITAFLWWFVQSFGLGIGYHRLLSHRGFKTSKSFEYFLTFLASIAMQAGAITWVTSHRIHHAFTDTDSDPHSPIEKGFWWSHIGWIFKGAAQLNDEATHKKYSPDLMKDKVHVFLNRYYVVPTIVLGLILLAIGGWSMVLWGIFLRVVWAWHCTWLVNSAAHLWGTRRFETKEDSKNNGFVALLTWGEGWHNNHHAHPTSARHGLTWYEFDINWLQLKVLEKIGLIWEMKEFDLKAYEAKQNKGVPELTTTAEISEQMA